MAKRADISKHLNTMVRQKQIADAARKLTTKYGSEHLTIRRIAEEIGVSEGAIYRHFKSKRDILFLMISDIEDNLIGDIEKGYNAAPTRLQTLAHITRNHISRIAQRKGVSFQVIAEIISLGDKKLNKKVADVIDKYCSRIKDILSEGVKTGEIRQDVNLEATAILFFSMIQGLVNMWALSDYTFNLEDKYASLWNVFREAVSSRHN